MKRMTRQKDEYECRIANGCPIEDWSTDQTGYPLTCDDCPIMKYINKLAEYEDKFLPVDEGTIVYLIKTQYKCKYDYKCPYDALSGWKCECNEYCKNEYLQWTIEEVPFNAEKHAPLWNKTVFETKAKAEESFKENLLNGLKLAITTERR